MGYKPWNSSVNSALSVCTRDQEFRAGVYSSFDEIHLGSHHFDFPIGLHDSSSIRHTNRNGVAEHYFDFTASKRIFCKSAASAGKSLDRAGNPFDRNKNARISAFCARLKLPG